jgi:predicted AlkP superfamily phosphohydrolase/phosphomutase
MEKAHWDLFMTAFSETHSAGHQFWHHTDPASPAYDPDISPEMSGAIRDAYIAVDAALGRILEELPPDVDVFAFSLHGLETHPAGRSFLKPLMERLGYQIPPTAGSKRDPLQILRDLIPGWARDLANRFLLPRSAQDAAVERLFATGCDWSRTRAVAEDSREGFPWVRINLQGREPEGIVAPGAEYEALCDEIAAEIQKLRVHPGGERAVREVWRTRQHFEGPHLDELPDLIVFWEKGTPIHAVVHPEAGIIEGDQPVLQTAQHRPESFFIAAGPHIRAGASSSSPAIIDLAPTMLHMLGSAIPEDMEGRVLTEILEHSGQPRCAKFNWKVNPWT